jgi:hypothetical protein
MASKSHPDKDLHNLLHTWKVDDRADPNLSVKVWDRIEKGRGADLPSWIKPLVGWVLRPVGSIVIVSAFVLLGAALAEMHSSNIRETSAERLAAEYVRSIDPIMMAGIDSGHGHP